MANIKKAFNFRGGIQVDTDVLVVRGQNVGIGSTIPTERLDVAGNIYAERILSPKVVVESIETTGVSTFSQLLVGAEAGSGLPYPDGTPQVLITTGIITSGNPAIGVVTYYGDGGRLLNLPTSQWLDVDVGLGFTSIYAQGYVGVSTDDPRFDFQVGGVPMTPNPQLGINSAQRGVGIDSIGNIYNTGVVSTTGEFVGVGSRIISLDASQLVINKIPNTAYGSSVITDTVYADYFIGTATVAEAVEPDADLLFNSATADAYYADTKFVTLDGNVSIGHDNTTSDVGDLDVLKATGNSVIYSNATNGSGNVYVGKERIAALKRRYGLLRFGGGDSGLPQSGVTDLDLVNYDVGNLNYYIHAGFGGQGATVGTFRWIYGQTDRILATLNRVGQFDLKGNLTATDPTLIVTGVSTFTGRASFGDRLFVTDDSTFKADVNVKGDINLDGNLNAAGSIQLNDVQFGGDITIGNDPTTGLNGVGITTQGLLITSDGFEVYTGVATVFNVDAIGNLSAQAADFTNVDATGYVAAASLSASDIITGPNNFSLNTTQLSVDNLVVNDNTNLSTLSGSSFSFVGISTVATLVVTNDINVPTLNGLTQINGGPFTFNGGSIIVGGSTISSSDITTPNATVTTGNITTINATTIFTSVLEFSSEIVSSSGEFNFNGVGYFSAGISTLSVTNGLTVSGDISVSGGSSITVASAGIGSAYITDYVVGVSTTPTASPFAYEKLNWKIVSSGGTNTLVFNTELYGIGSVTLT